MSDEIRLADDEGPRGPQGGSGRIQVRQEVLDEIDRHVSSDTTVEQGGVLVGEYHEPSQTIIVTGRIPAVGAVSDVASLRFTHETWDHVNAVMDQDHPGRRMVGWYHSHPHFGIFLSDYDQFIHQNFFREPWQVAYVVDPLLGQRGFFAWVDGELVRVASWATWRTDRADGEGPIGTPPPRPGPPPVPGADAPAAPTTDAPDTPRRSGGPSPWAIGGLVLLVGALVAAVLVVIRPFSGADASTIRIENVDAGDPTAPLSAEAVAGTVTPIGRVALEGIEDADADSLSWTYHPTSGAASSESVVVEVTSEPGTYEVTWRSDGLEDTGASTGELRASVCLSATRPPSACEDDDLRTAALATQVVVTGDPLTHLSAPSPDRFVTDADGHAVVPDERLASLPAGTSPSSLPEGVRLIASQAAPDGAGPTVFQFGVDAGGLGALAGAVDGATLVPHVGFSPAEDVPERPEPVLPDGIVRSTDGRAAVDLAPVGTVADARRAARLACGEDGISAACGIVDIEGRPDTGPVALASLIEMIDSVPDGAVAPLLVDAHPDGCPDAPPDGDALELVAGRLELRSSVLWVVGRDGCPGLADSLEDLDNVVVVGFDPVEGTVSVPGGTDLADSVAIVAGAAADGWSLDVARSPDDLAACLEEDGEPVAPDVSACAIGEASEGATTEPPTTVKPTDAPEDEDGAR